MKPIIRAENPYSTTPYNIKRGVEYPYYNLKAAKRVYGLLQAMSRAPTEHKWVSCEASGYKMMTIRLLYRQALAYILHHMDPERRVAALWPKIHLKDMPGGVLFMWLDLVGGDPFNYKNPMRAAGTHALQLREWRNEVNQFVENSSPGESFTLNDVFLSSEELVRLEQFLASLSFIKANINTTEIKLEHLTT